jgi:hypothetical protein
MLLTGVNTWGSTTPVIDDGDLCQNSEHASTAQDLLNKATFLREGVAGKAASFRLRVPLVASLLSSFAFSEANGGFRYLATGAAGRAIFGCPGLPVGYGKIVGYGAKLAGNSATGPGPHTVLPSSMPAVRLYRQAHVAGGAWAAATQVDIITDPSASIAAYDVIHEVSEVIDHTIVTANDYYVVVDGESGGTGGTLGIWAAWVDLAPV